MQRRLVAVLVFVVASSRPVVAGDAGPAVLFRARSLEAIQGQGKLLLDQIGLGRTTDQFVTLLKTKAGPRGLEGIDSGKPMGLFLHFDPDPAGALLVPVANERAFVDLLERLDLRPTKDSDGVYSFRIGLVLEVSCKLTQGYAWITAFNKNAFRARFDAATILGPSGPLLSGRVKIDQIPKDARQMVLSEFEDRMQQALKVASKAEDKPGQRAFLTAVYGGFPKRLAQLLQQGKEATVEANLDPSGKNVVAQLRLHAIAGTELAQELTSAGKRTSVFPAKAPAGTAAVGQVGVAVPAALTNALTQFVEEAFKDAEAQISDTEKKKRAQSLLAALRPTLDAGEVDAHFRLVGPSGGQKLGFVLGVKIRDGDKLGSTLRDLLEEARKQMPDAEQAKIQLDAEAVGATRIHRFHLPAGNPSLRQVQDILGDPTLSVAFRSDAVLFGLGADSLTALKDLIGSKGDAHAVPLLKLELDAGRLSHLLAPNAKASARAAIADPGVGVIHLTVVGGPSLQVDLSVSTAVLRFLGETREVPPVPAK